MLLFLELRRPQGRFLLANMRERNSEIKFNPDALERKILNGYAQQKGIPCRDVEEAIEIVDPFDTFHDSYFNDRRSQGHFAMITGLYNSIPRGELDDEAIEFKIKLLGKRVSHLLMAETVADTKAVEIIRELTPETAANLLAWVHGKVLHEADHELSAGLLTDSTVVKLVTFSRLDKLARRAVVLPVDGEVDDDDFDPEFELDIA